MPETVKKFKWIWAWQDDAEEKWLRQMSQDGYHLRSVDFAGFYTFEKGSPRDYVYRLDYRPNTEKVDESYLQLFQDSGWDHVAEFLSWHYFKREPKLGESTEIFTDVDSRVAKYKRLLGYLLLVLPSTVFLLSMPLWVTHFPGLAIGFQTLGLILIVLYVIAFIKISRRIKSIKKMDD